MGPDAQSSDDETTERSLELSENMNRPSAVTVPIMESEHLQADASLPPTQPAREGFLPTELILHILSFIPDGPESQGTIWACCLVARTWYAAALPRLYVQPYIRGSNFDSFMATICPSKNAHVRQSPHAALIRRLDMGGLVHNSSRSLTARLIGRVKWNLEAFVAPQTSFSINSTASLSKCTKLVYLDLSLMSTSIPHSLLFQTLRGLRCLQTLLFPRSSSQFTAQTAVPCQWPPRLKNLHLAGGIDDLFLEIHLENNVPPQLERLSIQHCSRIHEAPLLDMLKSVGPQLKHLTICHPMAMLQKGSLDFLLMACPALVALRVAADYIDSDFFELIPFSHTLRILDFGCADLAGAEDMEVGDIVSAILHHKLPDLRSLRLHGRLADKWEATPEGQEFIDDLCLLFAASDREKPLGIRTGVYRMHS